MSFSWNRVHCAGCAVEAPIRLEDKTVAATVRVESWSYTAGIETGVENGCS